MKNRPEPTLGLLALVAAAYDRPRCAAVYAQKAKEYAGKLLDWTAYQIAELISSAYLDTALLTETEEGYPDVLDACLRSGSVVILRMKPDQHHQQHWYGILYQEVRGYRCVMALDSEEATVLYERPLSEHATGEYIIILDRGDLERGIAAIKEHGILVR